MLIKTINRKGFEHTPLLTLENDNAIVIELCAFGASITKICLPDKHGEFKNIVLTLPSVERMKNSKICAGATVGPAAGRISRAELPILGKVYQLDKNDGKHTLHGGANNLSETIWQVKSTFCNEIRCGVSFQTQLYDGQNGFPGNRLIEVEYTLTAHNSLTIRYFATTDKTTFLNLTNHTYWNLSGDFSRPAYEHTLKINANNVYYNDNSHIPISEVKVADTPFDFRDARRIDEVMETNPTHPQLLNARGYNNAFVLNHQQAAVLSDETSGRRITIETEYPSLVFYSGGYLDNDKTADGQMLSSGCCLAFEPQYLPDAPRIMGENTPLLRPNETYDKTISFHFDVLM